ncbi:uncharacterized protein LOC103709460 [Phoenix dactylifera]|uniref:Uncharacterized protein LOC103709460 n=1 Tax=Phoenix dactylifera TaxID=42345 RepID=A0A8B8J5U4_PHODC|nr:uncharacterized protein LOC103709460 [Phoenix dactylifera]
MTSFILDIATALPAVSTNLSKDIMSEKYFSCTLICIIKSSVPYRESTMPASNQHRLSQSSNRLGFFSHGRAANGLDLLLSQNRSKLGQLGCRADSVMPLAFHPDLDVVFLQVDWKIYSFDLASDGFNEIGGEKGPNPEGERYLILNYVVVSLLSPYFFGEGRVPGKNLSSNKI